jgi:hypothetical protein
MVNPIHRERAVKGGCSFGMPVWVRQLPPSASQRTCETCTSHQPNEAPFAWQQKESFWQTAQSKKTPPGLSVIMSANLQRYASSPGEQGGQNCDRSVQQLVWVLISILLLLYLAATYVYWAKIESAWPIFR